MAKIRVAVLGTVGKSVLIETDLGPRVAALEVSVAALGAAGAVTQHRALGGLTQGDDHPQYTMWQAPETINAKWNFAAEPDIEGVPLTEFIQDVVGMELVENTNSVTWTYDDTAGELEANVVPEFIEDTVGAMLTDTSSVDLVYTDAFGQISANVICANPSGLIGMAAVNGVAATPLRSDGRHAIDPAIAPEWTASHGWADNAEIQLGTGNDLRIYHDGTKSWINNDTGILQFDSPGGLDMAAPSPDTTTLTINAAANTGTGHPAFRVIGSSLTGNSAIRAEATMNNIFQGFVSHNLSNGTNAQSYIECGNEVAGQELSLINTSTTYTGGGYGSLIPGAIKALCSVGGDPLYMYTSITAGNPELKIGAAGGAHGFWGIGATSDAWEDLAGDSGSFTATLIGVSGTVTGTIHWKKNGSEVTMWTGAAITGTSTSTTLQVSGIPAAITPTGVQSVPCGSLTDNSVTAQIGSVAMGPSMIFQKLDVATGRVLAGNFTNGGTKGLGAAWTLRYNMNA